MPKIRVTVDRAFRTINHPTERRVIKTGDEFEAAVGWDAYWRDWNGWTSHLPRIWFKVIEDHDCTCPLDTLFSQGCKCGGK